MGIFSKVTKPFKKVANKVIKPFQKISDKLLPNELRPFLPYATMFLPASGIMGQLGGMGGFAKMYGANMLAQAMGDPEADFEDLNQISGILSGLQGGLSGADTASNLRGMTTQEKLLNDPSMLTKDGIMNQMASAPIGSSTLAEASGRGLLGGAKDLALNIGAGTSDYLTGNIDTLRDVGSGRAALNFENIKNAGKALAPDFAKATGDVAVNLARPAMRDYEKQVADEEAEIEETTTANEFERASLQMQFMREADIDEDEIKVTLDMNNLGEYYTPPTESAAQGGIIGLKEGGMLNFGGREMDLRTGGFVPIW